MEMNGIRRPVSRVLSTPATRRRQGAGRPFLWDRDRSRPRATDPDGWFGNGTCGPNPRAAPIWSCSRWGLPCRPRCRGRGALLPHPFTLAWRERRAVCFLWHFPWGRPRRALPGTVFPWSPDFPPPRRKTGRERPSSRLIRPQMSARRGSPSRAAARAATATRRAVVPASAAPVTRSGRHRRWKAARAARVLRSQPGPRPTS